MGKVQRALTVLLLSGGLISVLHCDRGATGVDSCVELEQARCEMIVGCPNVAVVDEYDVADCRLIYRDQCEFGMADKANPDGVATQACMAALNQAEGCRGDLHLEDCTDPPEVLPTVDTADTTACQLLHSPQLMVACGFLAPAPVEETSGGGDPTGGTGGAGTGGSTG
jgi:hypothetical protein